MRLHNEISSILTRIVGQCSTVGTRMRIQADWHPRMHYSICQELYRRFKSRAKIVGSRKKKKKLIFTVTNAMIPEYATTS